MYNLLQSIAQKIKWNYQRKKQKRPQNHVLIKMNNSGGSERIIKNKL